MIHLYPPSTCTDIAADNGLAIRIVSTFCHLLSLFCALGLHANRPIFAELLVLQEVFALELGHADSLILTEIRLGQDGKVSAKSKSV